MRIKVQVHSHDTALPEHDQVQFHTPDHPGGLLVLRVPKGAPLPPVGAEYTAEFINQAEARQQDEHLQSQLDAAFEKGRAHAHAERDAAAPAPLAPAADNAHVAEGAERFDDTHGAGSDQGGA